jgi:hypothetical protein
MRIIATITGEGFVCTIKEHANGSVTFKADADIDADGANGQNGGRPAYTVRNDGSEHLANGGMGIKNGKVVFTKSWGPDIAVVDKRGNPYVTADGVVVTKTAYRYPNKEATNPAAWVDSETVPYIVVPPIIISAVRGIVKGCQAYATYKGKTYSGVVADVGPRTKIGEVSIAMAKLLGIPSSPRTGGLNKPDITYTVHPGEPAVVNDEIFVLQPS